MVVATFASARGCKVCVFAAVTDNALPMHRGSSFIDNALPMHEGNSCIDNAFQCRRVTALWKILANAQGQQLY